MECGYISGTLRVSDAHHLRSYEGQLAETFIGTPRRDRKIQKPTPPYKDKQTSPVVSMAKLNKVDEKVVATLQAENKELSLQELADKTGEPSKKVFKSLKKLFENEIVSTMARRYKLAITDSKAIKEKLAAKGEEEPEA